VGDGRSVGDGGTAVGSRVGDGGSVTLVGSASLGSGVGICATRGVAVGAAWTGVPTGFASVGVGVPSGCRLMASGLVESAVGVEGVATWTVGMARVVVVGWPWGAVAEITTQASVTLPRS